MDFRWIYSITNCFQQIINVLVMDGIYFFDKFNDE